MRSYTRNKRKKCTGWTVLGNVNVVSVNRQQGRQKNRNNVQSNWWTPNIFCFQKKENHETDAYSDNQPDATNETDEGQNTMMDVMGKLIHYYL